MSTTTVEHDSNNHYGNIFSDVVFLLAVNVYMHTAYNRQILSFFLLIFFDNLQVYNEKFWCNFVSGTN